MSLEEDFSDLTITDNTLLTIGVFDGVHTGHQKLLSELVNSAKKRQLKSGVITFSNHPSSQLGNHPVPPMLTSREEKIKLIKLHQAEFVATLDFSPELSQTSAREFCALLQHHLRMKGLVLGFDFAMGHNREGSLSKMEMLGKEMGFTTAIIPPVTIAENVVSSTAIRQLISQGKVRQAAEMLGRHYRLEGTVVSGKKMGRKLGFPTANIQTNPALVMPSNGIYATVAIIDGQRLAAATNIGTCPTFGGRKKTVESHIIDFDGSLYGKFIEIELIERIRDEITFSDEYALKAQIAEDLNVARSVIERITKLDNEY